MNISLKNTFLKLLKIGNLILYRNQASSMSGITSSTKRSAFQPELYASTFFRNKSLCVYVMGIMTLTKTKCKGYLK